MKRENLSPSFIDGLGAIELQILSIIKKEKEKIKMNVPLIIIKKRDGGSLTSDEISEFIERYTKGQIPDYQMASLLMAIFFKGMTDYELDSWTEAMIRSGKTLYLGDINGPKIDKHSTGGVGDKVSLSLAPLVAACGIFVPMISGRGLGHTGGTLDKLESLGMNVNLDTESIKRILKENNLVFAGQTEDLCPADRKIYALRDVTGTVDSIPLIASSIMSKKLAEGIEGLVLDVKVGKGAFMKDRKSASLLAMTMKKIGERRGIKVKAILTAMDEPLGNACGGSVEAIEAIEMLHGRGPEDYREVVLHLSAWMLVLAGICKNVAEGKKLCDDKIRSGEAIEKMRGVVIAQGGDGDAVDNPSKLPVGKKSKIITATSSGYLKELDAYKIGLACVALGAGRLKAEDKVDHGAGIILKAKVGDRISKGDEIAVMYTSTHDFDEAENLFHESIQIVETPVYKPKSLILEEV